MKGRAIIAHLRDLLDLPWKKYRWEFDWEIAKIICKRKLIEARKKGDDELAAILSEAKEVIKKKLVKTGHCNVCGCVVAKRVTNCNLHCPHKHTEIEKRLRKRALAV